MAKALELTIASCELSVHNGAWWRCVSPLCEGYARADNVHSIGFVISSHTRNDSRQYMRTISASTTEGHYPISGELT
jgi:hypothetical protein